MGVFKSPEHEAIRVQKLNSLADSTASLIAGTAGRRQVLPVVDGSIPPLFLQNADGSLIYAEI